MNFEKRTGLLNQSEFWLNGRNYIITNDKTIIIIIIDHRHSPSHI